MITCTVHLEDWLPDAHDNFTRFKCANFYQLTTKIEEILKTIQSVDSTYISEIKIELKIDELANIINLEVLKDFIRRHRHPIFKFTLTDTENTTLQQELDSAYWQAISNWQPQRNVEIDYSTNNNVLKQPFILESTITLKSENTPKSVHSIKFEAQEKRIHIPKVTEHTKSHYLEEPLYTGFSEIIEACCLANDSAEILNTINACIGDKGLLRILNLLSVEPVKSNLHEINQVFFSSEKKIKYSLPFLIRPEGQVLVQNLNEMPNQLIVHWLNWIRLNDKSINFKSAVNQIYQFYKLLQKYNVQIPDAFVQDEGSFFERISLISALLEPTNRLWQGRKQYYAVQASKLLILPIDVLKNMQQLITRSHCKWIRPEMIIDGFTIEPMNEQIPPPSHLAGFYCYAAQFMQDNRENAFYQIEALVNPRPTSDLEWQLAAWCATLPNQPSEAIFNRLKVKLNAELIGNLYAIPVTKRMSVDTLNEMMNLDLDFEFLFKVYAYLFTNHETAKEISNVLFSKPMSSEKISSITGLINQSTPDSVNLVTFKMLMLAIVDNEVEMQDCVSSFIKLSPENQKLMIKVLSSLDTESEQLKIEQVQSVIQDLLGQKSVEAAFLTHCSGVKFKYFNKSIDIKKIIDGMNRLLDDVKSNFAGLLDPKTKILIFSIASFFKASMRTELNQQIQIIEQLKVKIQEYEYNPSDDNLQAFLAELIKLDEFFNSFLRKSMQEVFEGNAVYKLGLTEHDTMKAFFGKLVGLYDNPIYRESLNKYLNREKLILLVGTNIEEESVLQKFIEADLFVAFSQQIQDLAGQKILVNQEIKKDVKDELFQKLSSYLGRLPISFEGFKELFKRCDIISQKIEKASEFETKCHNANLDACTIWQMLSNRIQTKEGIAGIDFWQASDVLLDCLIDNKDEFEPSGSTSLIGIYEALLKCSDVFSKEKHPGYWQLYLKQLDKFIKDKSILKDPMFGFLLKDSMVYVLEKGKEYDFKKNVKLYTDIGQKNPELMQTLQQLLADATPENQQALYAVLEKIRLIFEKQNSSDRQQVLARILGDKALTSQLKETNEILGWLLTHDNFVWFGLLAGDNNWGITELSQLHQQFNNASPIWSESYQRKFPEQEKNWKNVLDDEKHEVKTEGDTEVLPVKKPRNFRRWVSKRTSELVSYLNLKGSSSKQTVSSESIDLPIQENSAATTASLYWDILKNYPYPSVQQMTHWLGQQDLDQIKAQIEEFDTGDTQKEVKYDEEDINRWIDEVEFYNNKDWSKLESTTLKQRLNDVTEKINQNMKKSRQTLREEFKDTKESLRGMPHNRELQNDFIAILCTAYFKVVGKVPYPTQILALLLSLRLDNRNLIFEIDTGEGKGVTIGLLALMKHALGDNETVLVRTTTSDLVKQDLYEKKNAHFFNLFDVPSQIIDQKTSANDFKTGGIFYSAGRDFDVFSERLKMSGNDIEFSMDMIVDEFDAYVFDQNIPIKITEINKDLMDYQWIYPQINGFSDGIQNIRDLKNKLLDLNQLSSERVAQIQKLDDRQWLKWLKMSRRAKSLKENKDFVVRFNKSQDSFEAIPYENGELREGYDISDPLVSGLQQFLHAHLSDSNRQFAISPETRFVTYLAPTNFKNISSLIGLSGSIGQLSEIYTYQETINANSVRIGRFHKEEITENPMLVAKNNDDLVHKIRNLAQGLNQPLLILTDDIEEAHRIYEGLNKSNIDKNLKLLTGVEDTIERRQWLHGSEGKFAKAQNSITIATKVCSRGIDLSQDIKAEVFVLQVGVSDARESKQKRGRTGRAGEKGVYQTIVNLEAIARQYQSAFNFNHLPLTEDTLPTYVDKIQEHMCSENHQKRNNLRLKDWAKEHVVNYLKEQLQDDKEHLRDYFSDYYQHIHLWFMALPTEGMNQNEMIEKSLIIWDRVVALLNIRGKHLVLKGDLSLTQQMEKDANNYKLLVNPGLIGLKTQRASFDTQSTKALTESSDEFILEEFSDSATDLTNEGLYNQSKKDLHEQEFKLDPKNLADLKDKLVKLKPEISTIKSFFTSIFNFIPDIFQWLNPVATKTQQYLDSAWETFRTNPTPENWKAFYRLLLSAKNIHQQQSKQSFWRIDYWFDGLNKLRPWVDFSLDIERELELLNLELHNKTNNSDNIFNEIKKEISSKNIVLPDNTPKGLIERFMQWFQPLFKEDLDLLKKYYDAFMDVSNPENEVSNLENLNNFYQHLQKVKKFHEESQEWGSWRIDYWWYWQSRIEPWVEMANELPTILEDLEAKKTPSFKVWKNKQKDIGYFQLFYREHLIRKEQLRSRDRRYTFWFWEQDNPLSNLNKDYDPWVSNKDLTRKFRKYELDEVARFFPAEAMKFYNHFQEGTKQDDTSHEKQKTMYFRVLDVMKHMFNPLNDNTLSLDLSTHRLELFQEELNQWKGRREILAQLNQRP